MAAITITQPDDTWTHRRYYVDAREVVTIRQAEGHVHHCDDAHPWGHIGASFTRVGEHVEGCGRVATTAQWPVYLTQVHQTGPRYAKSLPDAYRIADEFIAAYYA